MSFFIIIPIFDIFLLKIIQTPRPAKIIKLEWKKKDSRILVVACSATESTNATEVVKNGFNVFVADNLWRGKKEYLLSDKGTMVIPNKNFHKVDLRDYKNCLKVTNKMDVVVHLADVVAGINYVFSNESSLYRSNILINTNTLHACITNKVKKYIR